MLCIDDIWQGLGVFDYVRNVGDSTDILAAMADKHTDTRLLAGNIPFGWIFLMCD